LIFLRSQVSEPIIGISHQKVLSLAIPGNYLIMLQRLYVHNFRCLENFELTMKEMSSALLIGKNILDRKSHLEPTLMRLLSDIPVTGDLINSLICGDIEL
jgi:hypothetical protein